MLCGDFAQLAPIEKDGNIRFCFESSVWKENLTDSTIYLSEIVRQTDPIFQRILTNLRLGQLTAEDKKVLNSRLITDESEADMVVEEEAEEGDEDRMKDGSGARRVVGTIKATVLYPRKKDVNRINTVELQKLLHSGAKAHTFRSTDMLMNKKSRKVERIKQTHIDTLNKCTTAPETLVLAIGAQVMLTKNKAIEEGLVNGSRGVVIDIDATGGPVVLFDNGITLTIAQESFEMDAGSNCIVRKQVPLILAWALTIHKCQGATLTNVITDLAGVFGDAQVYVTLSRCKSLEGLFIVNINYARATCNKKVKAYYQNLGK